VRASQGVAGEKPPYARRICPVVMLRLRLDGRHRLTSGGQMRAAGLVTAVRTLEQGAVARARSLATSGPSSQSAPRTAMSAWGPAEKVDEGVERHGVDWQGIKEPGIKEPYQLEVMPSMDAIRPWCHHAIRTKDAFWPYGWQRPVGRSNCPFGPSK
jgi:hypothetical protein